MFKNANIIECWLLHRPPWRCVKIKTYMCISKCFLYTSLTEDKQISPQKSKNNNCPPIECTFEYIFLSSHIHVCLCASLFQRLCVCPSGGTWAAWSLLSPRCLFKWERRVDDCLFVRPHSDAVHINNIYTRRGVCTHLFCMFAWPWHLGPISTGWCHDFGVHLQRSRLRDYIWEHRASLSFWVTFKLQRH